MRKNYVIQAVDQADAYYRHCRLGLTALPVLDAEDLTHFGIPCELRIVSVHEVPVLPWGWWVPVSDA